MFNCPVSELIVQTFLTMIRPAFFFFFFLDLRNIFKNVSVGGGEKNKRLKNLCREKKNKNKTNLFPLFFYFVFCFFKAFLVTTGWPICKQVLQMGLTIPCFLFKDSISGVEVGSISPQWKRIPSNSCVFPAKDCQF